MNAVRLQALRNTLFNTYLILYMQRAIDVMEYPVRVHTANIETLGILCL